MGDPNKTTLGGVLIDVGELIELRRAARWLQYLENAGVDNWPGVDYARELAEEDGFFEDE